MIISFSSLRYFSRFFSDTYSIFLFLLTELACNLGIIGDYFTEDVRRQTSENVLFSYHSHRVYQGHCQGVGDEGVTFASFFHIR